jgi:hypothetical protein
MDDDHVGYNNSTASASASASASSNAAVLFEEEEKAFQCIRELTVDRIDNNYQPNDRALLQLRKIFDKYLELPSLLDRYIAPMVNELTESACSIMTKTQIHSQTHYIDDDYDDTDDNKNTNNESNNNDYVYSSYDQFWNSPLPRILSAIYALSKVRGRKKVQKFLPHQVENVEPVLKSLLMLDDLKQQQKNNNQSSTSNNNNSNNNTNDTTDGPQLWESIYSMWNWMGILGKIPFDCEVVIDTTQVAQLFRLATIYLSETGPTRDVVSSCLACWLTRPDLEDSSFRNSFQQWSISVLKKYLGEMESNETISTTCSSTLIQSDIYTTMGVLQTLITILKISTAQRKNVLASMEPYWSLIKKVSNATNRPSNLLLRKYVVKWWTRLGVLYLPPRIASWRYQRGRRSLKENLQRQQQSSPTKSSTINTDNTTDSDTTHVAHQKGGADYFFFVPDQVEMAMGQVLAALKDSSTVVRWSAAKGVGRITSRLPAICAEDVIDAIMEFFDDIQNDNDWHGACLTLAELARRGLLLPHRLKDVIPKIVEAIHYDLPRRQTSVGAHVRDAACYTYWALARAYSPEILKPFVLQLGQSVVVAFLFDREVNCRRAASAAFQEMVGRQGAQNFKNGISILTTADYFSLGNRKDAYTTIALHVAQFQEHQMAIITHLFRVKLTHWDLDIRLLASQSLNQLTALNPDFMVDEVLPYLLEHCLDEKNVHMRHGATLGLAEVVLAFGGIDANNKYLSPQLHKLIAETSATIEKKRLYRGKGGEQMRAAVCRLIACISMSHIPLTVPQQVRLLDSVDTCLPHPTEMIQEQAGRALFALTRSYFPVGEKGPSDRLQKRVVDKYAKEARTSINPAATRGNSLALGCLPSKLLAPSLDILDISLSCLCRISHPNAKVGNDKDAETRRNALVSLSRILETVGLNPSREKCDCIVGFSNVQLKQVFDTYMRSMDDYNTDQRGDVGSKCRLAAMNGLVSLATITTDQKHIEGSGLNLFSTELCVRIIGLLLKQFSEKLDFVRSEAARCLLTLLDEKSPAKAYITNRQILLDALTPPQFIGRLTYQSSNWAEASITYPMVMKAAEIDEYFGYVISGLILSTGGLTKSVTQNSSLVLIQWVRSADEVKLDRLGTSKLINKFESKSITPGIIFTSKTIRLLVSSLSTCTMN